MPSPTGISNVARPNRGKKLAILGMLFNLTLYIADVSSDVYVAATLYLNYDEISRRLFYISIVIIGLSTLIVNITAVRDRGKKVHGFFYALAFLVQQCVLVRYVDELMRLKQENNNKNNNNNNNGGDDDVESKKIARVRYVEVLTESIPQWCLQTFIMIRLWSFPWQSIASASISFASLVWAFVDVRRSAMVDYNQPLNKRSIVLLFLSQLGLLVSRLSIIVLYIYSFRIPYVFGIRSAVMLFYLFYFWCGCETELWRQVKIFFMTTFDVTVSQGSKIPIKITCAACFLYFLETAGMISLFVWIEPRVSDHFEILRPIAIRSGLGGLGIGILCFLIFVCYHRSRTRNRSDDPSYRFNNPAFVVDGQNPANRHLKKMETPRGLSQEHFAGNVNCDPRFPERGYFNVEGWNTNSNRYP